MPGKEVLINSHIFDCNQIFHYFVIYHSINQNKWVAVWQQSKNLIYIYRFIHTLVLINRLLHYKMAHYLGLAHSNQLKISKIMLLQIDKT